LGTKKDIFNARCVRMRNCKSARMLSIATNNQDGGHGECWYSWYE